MDIVTSLLEKSNHEYEFLFHEKQLYSAAEGADYFGIEAGQTAPTLIIKTDSSYYALTFSGSRKNIDMKCLAVILGTSQVKLANKNTVFQITGFAPGDTPLIGINLPSIFDKRLLQYPFIYGGSGQPNRTLKISPAALLQLTQPVAFLEIE